MLKLLGEEEKEQEEEQEEEQKEEEGRKKEEEEGRKKEDKRKKGSCSHQSWVHPSALRSVGLERAVQRWLGEKGHSIRSQTGSRWSLPQTSS